MTSHLRGRSSGTGWYTRIKLPANRIQSLCTIRRNSHAHEYRFGGNFYGESQITGFDVTALLAGHERRRQLKLG